MIYLVYVSSAITIMNHQELIDLLSKAREKNSRLGITGLLLYKDGNFIQLLEGPSEAVHELYNTILQDPRHHRIMLMDEGPLTERQFGTWNMGFRDLNDPTVHAIPGYSEFMNYTFKDDSYHDDPNGRRTLLDMFREGR